MKQDDDEMPDLPLYKASTGKLKGGPKKSPDIKAAPTKKFSGPKIASDKGGKSSFKVPKGGKIGAPKAHNYVKASSSGKKAESKFSISKPSMPSKKTMGKKR